MEVNYLLQRLDSFEGIAILTSFGNAIDPAFKRRLTYRVTFPFPDEEMREQLWRSLIPPQVPVQGKLDFAGLSRRFRVSGGYIRNAALRAAFLPAEGSASPTSTSSVPSAWSSARSQARRNLHAAVTGAQDLRTLPVIAPAPFTGASRQICIIAFVLRMICANARHAPRYALPTEAQASSSVAGSSNTSSRIARTSATRGVAAARRSAPN